MKENNNKDNNNHCSFCKKEPDADNPITSIDNGSPKICYTCNKSFKNLLEQELMTNNFNNSDDFNYQNNKNHKMNIHGRDIPEDVKKAFEKAFGRQFPSEKPNTKKVEYTPIELVKPKEIKSFLDKYVIGQEEAKKTLAISVYNHYKKINSFFDNKDKDTDVEIELDKSNMMIIGPSGSGKTLLIQTLSKELNVPLVIVDATSLTQSGYVGDDVESILSRLYQEAGGDIDKCEKGIIFIDEIDKIAKSHGNSGVTKDVNGEAVQQALLKIIEGTKTTFPLEGGRKHPGRDTNVIDTSNILFIVGGAFNGLKEIIDKRLQMDTGIGFKQVETEQLDISLENIEVEDLIEFGFIPEFLGRIPVITTLTELSKEELKEIITGPKNSILKQFEYILKLDKAELILSEKYIDTVVERLIEDKVGARGIRRVIEKDLRDYFFNIEDYYEKQIVL
jgi:ATP-dependent Clp protease ATP-binding subunit ClpX